MPIPDVTPPMHKARLYQAIHTGMLAIPGSIIWRHFPNGILDGDVGSLHNTSNPILTTAANTRTVPAAAILAHVEAPAVGPTNIHGIAAFRVCHFVSVVRVGAQLRLVASE